MIELGGRKVVASKHATDKALVRVPLCRGGGRGGATYWVEQTAARALRDGRVAKSLPRWCVRGQVPWRTARAKMDRRWGGKARFVWNEAETVAMVVKRTHEKEHSSHERVYLVLTVLTPVEPPAKAPEGLTGDPVRP